MLKKSGESGESGEIENNESGEFFCQKWRNL
jgi:hypothetical protein